MPEHADPVVTVTPTIMDGTVVRWYRSTAAAGQHRATLSASRNGICIYGYLHDVPDTWLDTARAAWQQLRADSAADLDHIATHRWKHLLSGELEPIVRAGTE